MARVSLKGIKIYIDPGHGGQPDPDLPGAEFGTTGYHGFFIEEDGINEKDVNLSIALKLRDLLEMVNASIKMSRTTDTKVGLFQRAQEANNFGADLFVSIHNNAASDQDINGTMVLYPPRGIVDKTQDLAGEMSEDISQKLGTKNLGGIKRDDLAVLNETSVPAVLTECVFMTNPDEEELIISDEGQQLAAEGIFNGIKNFFLKYGGGVEMAVCPILPTDVPDGVLPLGSEPVPFVENLQRAINTKLPPNQQITVDGIYGPGTANALFSIQQQIQKQQGEFPEIGLFNATNETLAGCKTYNQLGLNCERVFPRTMPGLPGFNSTFETLVNLQNSNPELFECKRGGTNRNFIIGIGVTALILSGILAFRGR